LINPFPALIPALIWALAPIYYRGYLKKVDFLTLNFVRNSVGSAVLLVPAFYLGIHGGVLYGVLSGVITLAAGDSLFLIAIHEIGASIAAPVVYTYVLLIQLTAFSIGESVALTNVASALLVILGVFLLSRGNGGVHRTKGIIIALGGAVVWTVGQDLIKVATNTGLQFISLAFVRDGSAALALAIALLVRGRGLTKLSAISSRREWAFLTGVAMSDLALGSTIYVYSIATTGLALTVILTSISPFLTQIFSRLLGRERPTVRDILAGFLIVVALLIIAV